MRLALLLAAACFCSGPLAGQTPNAPSGAPKPSQQPPWPLQLEMRVPFEPTAFPSGQHVFLMYELHLTNFMPMPVSLTGIDVFDAGAPTSQPTASFDATQLQTMLQPLGGKSPSDPKQRLVIADGQTSIVFLSLVFDRGARLPERLLHRVSTSYAPEEGALISTRHSDLHVLGPPLEGGDWLASDGPSNDAENHHRRGVVILDGLPVDSRRFAIDWKQVKNGAAFSGDSQIPGSYYSYGKAVLAVADGRVVTARDGQPENIPGHGAAFHPAVPITLETVAGNTITLDLGGGQFAYYLHLQPGSLRVKAGDRVHRGQLLARVGCSGDAREPHLHFEVTTSPKLIAGEGLPYLIDRYTTAGATNGSVEVHSRELPLDQSVVTFPAPTHPVQ